MKKSKILVIITILCCFLLLTFVACKPNSQTPSGNNTPSGSNTTPSGSISSGNTSSGNSTSTVNQFEEFKHILTAVINKYNQSSTASTMTDHTISGGDTEVYTPSEIREIFDYMDTVDGKEPCTNQKIESYATLNLIGALAYAELLNEYGETDAIYDTPMQIKQGNTTTYVAITSKNKHKYAYLYSISENNESLYVYDIYYLSDEQFSATVLVLSMDELELSYSAETKATSYYMYGDTNDTSLFMSGTWGENSETDVIYSNGAESFSSSSLEVGNACFEMVEMNYIINMNINYARSLKESCDHSFTWEQYLAVSSKLGESFGIEM